MHNVQEYVKKNYIWNSLHFPFPTSRPKAEFWGCTSQVWRPYTSCCLCSNTKTRDVDKVWCCICTGMPSLPQPLESNLSLRISCGPSTTQTSPIPPVSRQKCSNHHSIPTICGLVMLARQAVTVVTRVQLLPQHGTNLADLCLGFESQRKEGVCLQGV